ncbi:NifB/NifX family molybdenum-iron cluster-binding protein [Bacteroidota bacterium]
MKKTIAIPVDENDFMDPHFGHCKIFILYAINNDTIVSEDKLVPPPHEPGLLPRWLAEHGVTDIIAGGIGNKAINIFTDSGVNVFVGAPPFTALELIEGFLAKSLTFTANYCKH